MTKNKKKYQTIDGYISTFPKEIQEILKEFKNIISKSAPQAEGVINYNIPTYKLNGNLVHFVAYKTHIGFYPTPYGIEEFKKELKLYETSKGSIKFPIKKQIPFDLIKKIVEFRVAENLNK